MQAELIQIKDKIICNLLDCEGLATFKWFYQATENERVNQIATDSNIAAWLGWGQYFCEISCTNGGFLATQIFSNGIVAEQRTIEIQQQYVSEFAKLDWDFNKIPKSETKNIRRLVLAEKWKDLVLIHNLYDISQNSYCCDMSDVAYNFKEYLKKIDANAKVRE